MGNSNLGLKLSDYMSYRDHKNHEMSERAIYGSLNNNDSKIEFHIFPEYFLLQKLHVKVKQVIEIIFF